MPIPETAFVESNNYEFSFDLHYNSTNETYFHLVQLDGSAPGKNIFLALVAGGTYWRLANFETADIYDNSGDDQGCNCVLPEILSKMRESSINVKFVILGDIIEIYAEGRRLISVPFSAFGNNRYSSRRSIPKGTLTGFFIHCTAGANEMSIDNFVMKEAKYGETYYSNAATGQTGQYFLPLTYANLYCDNFTVSADYTVSRALVENGEIHAYPRIGLLMNQIMADAPVPNDPSNFVNAQIYLDREFATPWIGAVSHVSKTWNGVGGEYVQANFDNVVFKQTVAVSGNNVAFTVDTGLEGDHRKTTINTTFADIGIPKGKLLGMLIGNDRTTSGNVEFFGYEAATGIRITAVKTRVLKGQEVVLNAKIYGEALANGVWYVDGQATDISNLHYSSSTLAKGRHTFAYGTATIKSQTIEVEIFENMISIVQDKTTMYPTETATFTATAEGDFEGKTLTWKVNNQLLEGKTGDTLELSGLEPGVYKVKCVCEDVVSNELSLTVKEPKITISTTKGSFDKTETATITAESLGVADADVIEWYVNDQKASTTGKTFELALTPYAEVGFVEVKAMTVSGIASNKLTIYVTYDLYGAISSDENWKQIYKQEVTEQFGPYEVVEDEAGNYYHPTNAGGGNDASFPAVSIETQKWSMEYDLLVPESVKDYEGEYYVYPQAQGMDSKNPTDAIELAVAVGPEGLRTYVKTHISATLYEYSDYNTGKDLSYDGEIAKIGWNRIVYAMEGNNATFYVNGELVFFTQIPYSTIPSGFIMSMYPGSGGEIPLGFKNFTIKGVVEPPPAVTGVTVTANKVAITVGESVTLSATVRPYNAETETIEWYVNNAKVEGQSALTFVFTPAEVGSYNVVCKINGIASAAKTITVTTAAGQDSSSPATSSGGGGTPKRGCGGSIVATSAFLSLAALFGVALIFVKKREEN